MGERRRASSEVSLTCQLLIQTDLQRFPKIQYPLPSSMIIIQSRFDDSRGMGVGS